MKTLIAKRYTFEAAHHLPNHDGPCARPHGHSYTVEVGVLGNPKPIEGSADEGMVCDFAVLDRAWSELALRLDHRDLNDSLPVVRTTCELLAAYVYEHFSGVLFNDNLELFHVRVSETAKSYAEVRG